MPYDGSTLLLNRPAAPAPDRAPWHAARPHLLATALSEAKRVAPHLSHLADRWLGRMPRRPQASQNIRAICRDPSSGPLLLDDAVTCPWFAVNTDAGINALCFDVDHDDALEIRDELQALGCPIPDIVMDPWSGRAHAVLWLATSVRTTEDALPKPQKTASYAARLMAAALRATLMPQTGLIKSPWGCVSALTGKRLIRGQRPSVPARWEAYQEAAKAGSDLMWITFPGTGPCTDLRHVINALAPRFEFDAAPSKPPKQRTKRRNRGAADGRGRNCELFDLTRWWAYDHAEMSTEVIHAHAAELNGGGLFATPLPPAEVTALARSVGRYMRERYRPKYATNSKRGRDREAGAELDTKGRRVLAGLTTAAGKVSKTDTKLLAGLAALRAARQPLTQEALAAASGVGIRTIQGRWHTAIPTPHFGALSDNDRRARPRSLQENPSSLASLADCWREQAAYAVRIVAVVTELEELATMWSRPGADPGTLPVVPADLAHLVEIRQARAAAIKALQDAQRRTAGRQARQEATDRMEEMTRRAQDRRTGWIWFRTVHLADLEMECDAREAAAEEEELRPLRVARDAAFGARWRQWRRATQLAHPPRRLPRDLEADLAALPY